MSSLVLSVRTAHRTFFVVRPRAGTTKPTKKTRELEAHRNHLHPPVEREFKARSHVSVHVQEPCHACSGFGPGQRKRFLTT